jgi:Rrf2 family protein
MFQLSKKVEYGLIAVRHMAAGRTGQTFTAKEIAEGYSIPYELLAKIMQKLVRKGFLVSYQGANGGYALLRNPETITVSSVIDAIEESNAVRLVQCEAETPGNCIIFSTCTIKDPLMKLQGSINQVLQNLTVKELV